MNEPLNALMHARMHVKKYRCMCVDVFVEIKRKCILGCMRRCTYVIMFYRCIDIHLLCMGNCLYV